jgi:hypothetical protein
MSIEDARARRITIQYEIAARADRYEQDTAPQDEVERAQDVIAVADEVLTAIGDDLVPKLLELAGRVQAWLEAVAEQEQKT